MSDWEAELERLVAEVREHEGIADAFLAKSFTDRLVIVDVGDGETVPADVTDRLADHDVRSADDVYDDGGAFVGHVGNGTRHHFVDVQTRGEHQSYVVD
ncbi:hypothetical protein [Halopiger xanaduensis]|uniref:Uncharacterized protein n=1 Tax=Halopiger xanaduensis (strain DSM 18323 / JCM 14033 / SH-6) TaxID=797210 RepID=F8DAA7_HALXS|nr:hypothetical protein [Halopiger xanaduensis]AEH38188.1 hypothetical protein Halxa_3577 [Halopiger xanaduensis SH-6]